MWKQFVKAYFFLSKINIYNMLNLHVHSSLFYWFILEFMFWNYIIFICSLTNKLCYF